MLPWINSLWRVPLILLGTGLLATISVVSSLWDSSGRAQHACARAWGRFIIFVSRVRVDVSGLEHIDPGRGYVFTANHLSMFDHWALLAKLPCQFRFVSKESLFRIPFLGWHLKRAGSIAVDRSNHRRTVRSFQQAAEQIKRGVSFVIYPEGARTWGDMLAFKRGSFLLPVHARAPIVPVTINGAHKLLARGSPLIRPGSMGLVIHSPLEVDACSRMSLDDLAQHVRNIVASAYRKED